MLYITEADESEKAEKEETKAAEEEKKEAKAEKPKKEKKKPKEKKKVEEPVAEEDKPKIKAPKTLAPIGGTSAKSGITAGFDIEKHAEETKKLQKKPVVSVI